MRNKTKRLGALGATALVALVVIGPMSASAQVASTTTTTVPQTTKTGSVTNLNQCTSVVDLGSPATPTETNIKVQMTADGFPQPHRGDIITLSNVKQTLTIPADLLQLGVDANIIKNGDVIPSVVKTTITGIGTKEQIKTIAVHTTTTIHVGPPNDAYANGVAFPLSATISIPNTKWTPLNGQTDVFFAEKAVKVVSTIDLLATLQVIAVATFDCHARGNAALLAIGGDGAPEPTLPPTTATPITDPPTVAPTAGPTVAPQATTTELPRTGSNTGLLLGIAVASLSIGLFALRTTRRNGHFARSQD